MVLDSNLLIIIINYGKLPLSEERFAAKKGKGFARFSP